MGKSQRVKGRRGEQELVLALKAAGIPAKRISMMESGFVDKGDVLVADTWKAEVKIGAIVPDWLYKARKEGEDLLFCKRDRKKWLIVMDLEMFLDKFI